MVKKIIVKEEALCPPLGTDGGGLVGVLSGSQDETRLRLAHPGPREVPVLETRPLDVYDPLRPHWHLQDHLHRRVQLHRRQEHHKVILKEGEEGDDERQ